MNPITTDQHITNMEEAAIIESEALKQSEIICKQFLGSGTYIHKGHLYTMHEFVVRDDIDEKYCESLIEGHAIDDDIDEKLFLFCRGIYEGTV
jgi:hypothetical protein